MWSFSLKLMKTKEEWLQWVYSEDPNRLIYRMDDLEFPELDSLIRSGILVGRNQERWAKPMWMTDKQVFCCYGRMFTILEIYPMYDWQAPHDIKGVRVLILDIDDGDNFYTLETTDISVVNDTIEFLKNKHPGPILDTQSLLNDLEKIGFKPD